MSFRVGALSLVVILAAVFWYMRDEHSIVSARVYPEIRIESFEEEEGVDRIVLITVDTLRADHIHSNGYPRETSPFFDALAREGARFERTVTSMATTAPAHASILTSRYPGEHMVLKNGHRMDDELTTLAEVLTDAGYLTAAFVSTNHHFAAGNIHQGFALFDEPVDPRPYRDASDTVQAALDWIGERSPDEPFFLWVHLFDCHHPWSPPARFVRELAEKDTADPDDLLRERIETQNVDLSLFDNDEDDLRMVLFNYDAEILYVNRELSRLYEAFRKRELGPRTMWAVTSDHGEGLGNHSWMYHGKNIYNEQLRVPMIVHLSSRPVRDVAVERVVETVDLLPTVLELTGTGPVPEGTRGASLVPLLFGRDEDYTKTYAFAQRRWFDPPVGEPNYKYEAGRKFSIDDGEYKYIHRTEGDDELYSLTDDPHELENLIGKRLPAEERLLARILELVGEMDELNEGQEPVLLGEEALRRLEGIGYTR